MRTHKNACLRDLTEERVELRPIQALLDRVHPDKDAIEREQLLADRISRIVRIDDRLGLDAKSSEGAEDTVQPPAIGQRRSRLRAIPLEPPQKTDLHRPTIRTMRPCTQAFCEQAPG